MQGQTIRSQPVQTMLPGQQMPVTKVSAVQVLNKGEKPRMENMALPVPGSNQILVKMEYAPINPMDLEALEGTCFPHEVQGPCIVGLEGSGFVVNVGPDLIIPHKVGDKVAVAHHGTWAEYIVVNSDWAFAIPQEIPMERAAMHFMNPWMVQLMMKEILVEGHKCVVNTAGSSAIGKMLIQKCIKEGIKIIAIVKGEDTLKDMKTHGATFVLDQNHKNFVEDLKMLCQQNGCTLAFDCVGGDMTPQLIRAMPAGSSIIVYGDLSGKNKISQIPTDQLLFKQMRIRGVWMWAWATQMNPQQRQEVANAVFAEMKEGIAKTDIVQFFKINDWSKAIDYYKDHSVEGKVLIKL